MRSRNEERPRRVSAEAVGMPKSGESIGGAEAKGGPGGADSSASLILALAAADSSRELLARYALETDTPDWRLIDAADELDAARGLLALVIGGADATL